ncbi:lactonase family protein [Pelomonas sp. V22]|uniref:lactonase family protein n=1 Tax=Pelomonas sp. V22 TaxID=2822139 RepID=UPI0024A8D99E|nr:beta-propeller fold lactonase family protein [Pelomonas sp. V22]MDI4634917.1 lactonase family protein [Pelomonas sp. V22]
MNTSTAVIAHLGCYAEAGHSLLSLVQEPQSGALRPVASSACAANASWLLVDPQARRLYAAHEEARGSISVHALDAQGLPRLLQQVGTGGAGPVHLCLDAARRRLWAAHYGDGTLGCLPLQADGGLDAALPARSVRALVSQPETAPSHPHMLQLSSDGRWLLASDLGLNRLLALPLDHQGPAVQSLVLPAGSGPRHFVQQGGLVYLLNEQRSTLAWLSFDAASGAMQLRGETSSLSPGYAGRSYASDLRLSADGRHLYALNRLHDSIAIFELQADGTPRLLGHEWTRGSYPRSATFDPAGRFFYVCNQRSEQLTVFERQSDGGLRFTGLYLATPSPACLVFG